MNNNLFIIMNYFKINYNKYCNLIISYIIEYLNLIFNIIYLQIDIYKLNNYLINM